MVLEGSTSLSLRIMPIILADLPWNKSICLRQVRCSMLIQYDSQKCDIRYSFNWIAFNEDLKVRIFRDDYSRTRENDIAGLIWIQGEEISMEPSTKVHQFLCHKGC